MSQKILIIEDEKELADILGEYLKVEGFEVKICNDGKTGLEYFKKEQTSLVLLDIMLPLMDGITVCREIRSVSDVPVIMVSAKSGEMDKVVSLGIGADDYVTKPFSPLELVARVKAQLRRYQGTAKKEKDTSMDRICVGVLSLVPDSYEAYIEENSLNLTTKEFEILLLFAKNPGQVFSKSQIYEQVWGYQGVCDDNSVTVYINRIREKLKNRGCNYIKTIWGAGYKLAVEA
ncbi:MAG: response regulator transcription factor [Lachnospiraceae bacterium]|uniref:response regulator transcription factor n=1 Tax=Roseburia hominis TaxID=301301 RepID=UPI001F38593B|nr:response regulator transcription factor [Roseburia hominis]MCI5712357.1 response regulator transcription factor [Lachnospiraceae bacterium]MDD6169514.1 response regulator transcription factor [Lachnospiraceae bacterium]